MADGEGWDWVPSSDDYKIVIEEDGERVFMYLGDPGQVDTRSEMTVTEAWALAYDLVQAAYKIEQQQKEKS